MTKVTPLDTAFDPHSADTGVLLEVRDLEVEFRMRSGTVKAANKVSYQVDKGDPRHRRRVGLREDRERPGDHGDHRLASGVRDRR